MRQTPRHRISRHLLSPYEPNRRREKIFFSFNDYELFITVFQKTVEMFTLNGSACCLRSDHYHLLIHTPNGNISRCIRHINGVYTQRFNRAHKNEGQLFR
ncbi:MAG: transposase [Proteobacteria bacterium]|nr:transposase [Pseudomonadota bacterium]MBU1059500.1 transposase [Pseudomonadota bacterium]